MEWPVCGRWCVVKNSLLTWWGGWSQHGKSYVMN